MKNELQLEKIKEELEKMEEEIIKERHQRANPGGSIFSYRLYEIRLDNNREKEYSMSYEERKQAYNERFEDIIKQHQINIEDTLDKTLSLIAIKAIHNARKWQLELKELKL